jgi:hypothetical protein
VLCVINAWVLLMVGIASGPSAAVAQHECRVSLSSLMLPAFTDLMVDSERVAQCHAKDFFRIADRHGTGYVYFEVGS